MENKTKIAVIAPYKIFPAKMGGHKAVVLFYKYLGALLPTTIISTKNNEFPEKFNATFIGALGNSVLRYINPFLFFKIKKILKDRQIRHLIIEHPYFGWLGILLKRFAGVKLVVHSHNIEATRFKSMGKWWWPVLWQYEKLTYRNADIVFFITEEDRLFAIDHYRLQPEKCYTATYGIELDTPPPSEEKNAAKTRLQQLHAIAPEEKILLFNGTLDYKPNRDALDIILNKINPLLQQHHLLKYKIIICGKNLPEAYNYLQGKMVNNIIYAGFVNDVEVYFKGADIFINPVIYGGGIKTKLVESLGAGLSCVSTASGAIGIDPLLIENKMTIVADGDWDAFTSAIEKINPAENTPIAFFNHFYWGNIAEKAAAVIQEGI